MARKLLIAGMICCMALVFTGCATMEKTGLWKKPGVKFSNLRIAALSSEGITVDLDLDISNPNAYSIFYGAMEYTVNLQKKDLISGKLEQSGSIGAGKTQKVTLPIALKFADVLDLMKNMGGDTFAYVLDAAMLFDIPVVGEVKLPFQNKGSLPIPKAPGISLVDFNIENFSMAGAEVKLTLNVDNPNTFDLILGGFDYVLGLNGKSILSGKSVQKQTLGAEKNGNVDIAAQLSFLDGGMALYNILLSGGALQYDFNFSSTLGSNLPALQNLPFKTQKTGTVRLTK